MLINDLLLKRNININMGLDGIKFNIIDTIAKKLFTNQVKLNEYIE